MSPELKRLLYAFNDKYGETHISRTHKTEYVAIHKTKRKEVIWYLVNTLKNRGKERDYFESPSFQKDLSDFFFPDGSTEGMTKAKRDGAKSVIERELNEILPRIWPEEDLFDEVPVFQELTKEVPYKAEIPYEPEGDKPLPIVRPDASYTPYDIEDTIEDVEFLKKLREIADE